MSNHSGSYLLNDVLKLLEKNEVFVFLGKEKTVRLLSDIVRLGDHDDCNPGEILEEIGERLGICYYCLNSAQDLEDGVCSNCRE